jgi:membrane protease YdiL (CAAX protease family)
MNHLGDLLLNLLVIAIVPAIGEELLFRGYLQQSFSNWLSNPHVAIIVTAVLFSAIHLHFQAFLPRFILGVLLGYLFYWSGSLWLPILAHFANNAQAVIISYPTFKVDSGVYSVLSDIDGDPMMAFFSFASVVVLLFMFYKTVSIKKD